VPVPLQLLARGRSFAGIMTGMGSGGRKAHVRHEAAGVHHAARRRGGLRAFEQGFSERLVTLIFQSFWLPFW
jgi:hypothetical protein